MNAPPLTGLRVIDLSMLTPGPFCSQVLADLGAVVLKVERPPIGDLERMTMPTYFRAYNRGKYSIALDLTDEAERAVLLGLVADADVVIEGFRPGVVKRLKVAFEDLAPLNPRLVYASLSGFGQDGPRAMERGHDPEYQAIAGSLHFARGRDGVPVYSTAGPTFDYAAAMYTVVAILAARSAENGPTHVEVPVFAAGVAFMFPRLVESMESTRGPIEALCNVWRTSDGRFLTAAAPEDNAWPGFCLAIGRPDLAARDDLAHFEGRLGHADELNEAFQSAFSTATLAEWMQRLTDAEVPAGPILEPAEVFDDPQVVHLDLLHREPSLHASSPILGFPTRRLVDAPQLDEHGALVRAEGWAGLDAAES